MSSVISSSARERVARAFEEAGLLRQEGPTGQEVFISLADRDAALASLDPDAPLAGWTFAVKDNIDVAGLHTTAACPSFGYRASSHATAVAALMAAGATCIGKTNLDQFATGLVGTRSPYGTAPNPLDARLAPGGSSSGSAVAVARGVVDLALGTDTAGSGRVPAAQCRIVGVKPTPGALSTRGVVPAVRSIDCVSVFGTEVAMANRARQIMQGDDGEAYSRPIPPFGGRLRRLGIPVGTQLVLDGPLEEAAWARTLEYAATMAGMAGTAGSDGVELVPVDISPLIEIGRLLYQGAWVAERHAAVGHHLHHPDVDPVVRAIIEPAAKLSAMDAFRGIYQLAELRRTAASVWRELDGLLVPTTPGVATLEEIAADPIGRNSRLGHYTNGINFLGWCAIAVPGADRADGWPFGVTVAGPGGADDEVARIGAMLTGQDPPDPALSEGWDLVVVGAHLSGLALNHQLLIRGAVRVTATTTAPCYRLWAMAGGAVPRPALEHVGPGGAALPVEVWRLPNDTIGSFLSEIPAPLGLGRVQLADGSERMGFIAEPRSLLDATDITGYGGWRNYLEKS